MTAYLGKLLNNCVHDLRHVMARMRGLVWNGLCRGSCTWLSSLQLTHRLEQIDLHIDVIVYVVIKHAEVSLKQHQVPMCIVLAGAKPLPL